MPDGVDGARARIERRVERARRDVDSVLAPHLRPANEREGDERRRLPELSSFRHVRLRRGRGDGDVGGVPRTSTRFVA